MVHIRVITPQKLGPDLVAAWSRYQCEDPQADSPYFRPEFTAAVASVRKDVEIGVLEDGGKPVGFFPFQRAGGSSGRPAGGRLSDFHGLIACKALDCDAEELLRGCGLRVWQFDHVPASQTPFQPYHVATAPSPYMDLSQGFEAYETAGRQQKADPWRQTLRKARKLHREIGPLRFEARATDRRVLAALIDWKRAQYQQTGVADVLSFPWATALLERILEERNTAFEGMLSALYAGDRLAAVQMGMRSHHVLHWWFPAYAPDLASYSPGRVFLVELAKAAESLGIRRIDLGRGMSQLKREMMSAAIEVAEGCVDRSPVRRSLRAAWRHTREKLRASRLRGALRLPYRLVRRLRDRWEFR